ncbi:MATE family efflux transporter [Psychrilyobacter atlanticus]|uniref:MATE family efflux transporter n=1 Tax=Psychrilyobacter atlanticus TaxID=271091 RepID=UPI000402D174|nr:MATE family efflux transporter [Psychrilyobacter atlanticus]
MDALRRLETEKISKLLMEFSIPAIVGSLVFALYNIVDRIFIGKGIGAYAMTGLSITFPIFTLYIAIGMLIGQGGGSIVSLRLGEGKKDKADKALGNTVTLFTVSSILLMILGRIFLDDLLLLFGATENTLGYARDYMSIINLLVFFNFMAMGMNNLMRSEGCSKLAMKYMVAGAVMNIVLDPILIFWFDMGIKGAAIATAFSNVAVTIAVFYHFIYSKNSHIKLKKENLILDSETVKEIFKIGVSPFTLQVTTSLVAVACNKTLLAYGGDLAVGAMGIVNSIYMFMSMIISGIRAGSQPIIGYNYGAGKFDRVVETLKISLVGSMLIAAFITLLAFFRGDVLINLFNDGNEEILRIGERGLKICLSMGVLNAFYIIGANYFQSIDQAVKSVVLNLIRQVVLFVPLFIILPKYYGIDGIWLIWPISDIVVFFFTGYFIRKNITELKARQVGIVY